MRARSLKDDDDVNYVNENFHSPAISISMNLGWDARKHPSAWDGGRPESERGRRGGRVKDRNERRLRFGRGACVTVNFSGDTVACGGETFWSVHAMKIVFLPVQLADSIHNFFVQEFVFEWPLFHGSIKLKRRPSVANHFPLVDEIQGHRMEMMDKSWIR